MEMTKWKLDPVHSELQFKTKHMMVSYVTGNVKKFNVTAEALDDNFENAQVSFTADLNSIDTGNEKRDAHLKAADFFETEKYPQMSFKSESLKKIDEENFELKGNLTLKGISNPVKLKVEFGGEAKDAYGNTKAGFSISGKINRKDWGITFNAAMETGGMMLSDEIKILGEMQLAKVNELVEA